MRSFAVKYSLVVIAIVLIVAAFMAIAHAQNAPAPAPKYVLNEKQSGDLRVKQLEFQLARMQYEEATRNVNNAYLSYKEEGDKIVAANKWEAQFDPQNGVFTDKPKTGPASTTGDKSPAVTNKVDIK